MLDGHRTNYHVISYQSTLQGRFSMPNQCSVQRSWCSRNHGDCDVHFVGPTCSVMGVGMQALAQFVVSRFYLLCGRCSSYSKCFVVVRWLSHVAGTRESLCVPVMSPPVSQGICCWHWLAVFTSFWTEFRNSSPGMVHASCGTVRSLSMRRSVTAWIACDRCLSGVA